MQPQLFVSLEEPRGELFSQVINRQTFFNKPLGGLWTSTYLGVEYGSNWVQWCLANDYQKNDGKEKSWIIYPKENVNIITINSWDDLTNLMLDCRINTVGSSISSSSIRGHFNAHPDFSHFDCLDYEKLATMYDGIRLTERGQRETRFGTPNLYTWDCESTLWLHWSFDQVEYLGEIEYKSGWE